MPSEIEAVLATHPGVAAVAVASVPDPLYGEPVAACVQLARGALPGAAEPGAFCQQQVAPFKVPSAGASWRGVPRTPTGKIQEFVLQHALADEEREVAPSWRFAPRLT